MSEDNEVPCAAPTAWTLGDDIDWNAPWVEVYLRVELPFWMMVAPTDLEVEINGHKFPVTVSDHFFEYSYGHMSDSKHTVLIRGSRKSSEDLRPITDYIRTQQPEAHLSERKCKTIVRMTTRCNSSVATKIYKVGKGGAIPPSAARYIEDLSRGHLAVVNRVIQAYRLATYDYFAHEVAAWDVPFWYIDFKNGAEVTATLVPCKGWDHKPFLFTRDGGPPAPISYLDPATFRDAMDLSASPGEAELMDAINLMERGDYGGAVRRVVTSLEVLVEAQLRDALTIASDAEAAATYLAETEDAFLKRVGKLCGLRKSKLPFWRQIKDARTLRHKVVHGGFRLEPRERGKWQKTVDVLRWAYNWFEDDPVKRDVREKRIALRSLGRDMTAGIFRPVIKHDGIHLSPIDPQS
ncbi:hypothetical protein [Acidisoma sp. S159]|uniref:hypothetical protein n=1 Tax=Acidisoma sp. S159 TaxID=1747225 RepID=UPI00131D46E5|nr:hypothetical protein [Acidisoma sp. S159]